MAAQASEGTDRVKKTIDLLRRVEDARAGTNVLGAVGRDAENDVVLRAEARDGVACREVAQLEADEPGQTGARRAASAVVHAGSRPGLA